MRIVSVCRQFPKPDNPAAGRFVFNRVAAMARVAPVSLIQPVPFMPVIRPLPAWARPPERAVEGLLVTQAPMFYVPGILKFLDPWWLARAIRPCLDALHRSTPIDALDAHFAYPDGVACVATAQKLGIDSFITIRGVEVEQLRIAGMGRRIVKAMRAATGCISVSHSLKRAAVEHGVPEEKVRVIHNAIDTATFSAGDRNQARAELGQDGDCALVVSVGNLISGKRHHVLIQAFARLYKCRPNAKLIIIGGPAFETTYPNQLRRQVRELGIDGRVTFAGSMEPGDVARWLRAADVFALGTAREGCCNAVLEALASGTPVVTTPVGDNAHFVRPGTNGFLVEVDDVEAMEAALDRSLVANWNREAISRDLIQTVGTWESVAKNVLAFMKECRETPR